MNSGSLSDSVRMNVRGSAALTFTAQSGIFSQQVKNPAENLLKGISRRRCTLLRGRYLSSFSAKHNLSELSERDTFSFNPLL